MKIRKGLLKFFNLVRTMLNDYGVYHLQFNTIDNAASRNRFIYKQTRGDCPAPLVCSYFWKRRYGKRERRHFVSSNPHILHHIPERQQHSVRWDGLFFWCKG